VGGVENRIELAPEYFLLDALGFAPIDCRIQAGGANAKLGQGVDLILHQGNQRRDDHGTTRAEQGRNLEAKALAAAGRHQDEGVAAAFDVIDDLGLGTTKGRIAENIAQDLQRGRVGDGCGRHRFKADFRG